MNEFWGTVPCYDYLIPSNKLNVEGGRFKHQALDHWSSEERDRKNERDLTHRYYHNSYNKQKIHWAQFVMKTDRAEIMKFEKPINNS
jgi:hypothetical protein